MQKLISIIMSLITFLTGYFASMFPSQKLEYDFYKNVRYGTETREIMDIYVPKEAEERDYNGCILFIHGGSWSNGDKKEMASRCERAARNGYIAATMNYKLFSFDESDNFTVEVMLDEIGLALEGIKKFSDDNDLNITRAALYGYSSGAHISMLYSYTREKKSPINLVFTANMVGPSDLSYGIWGDLAPTLVSALSGKKVTKEMMKNGSAEEIVASVSPVTYIKSTSIPSLFAYGGKDIVVPLGNGESIKRKFERVGGTYDYVLYPNSNHTLLSDPEADDYFHSKLNEYCEKYFGY